jgi:hypothetical protein
VQYQSAAQVVIFGGGVAGLWLLDRLRQSGISALLFESNTLGGGQTGHSQGIIHGGMKYALQGTVTNEVQAMTDIPALWRHCLTGRGEINLSRVPVLSAYQYLWMPHHKWISRLTGFFANAALKSRVYSIAKDQYPSVFQHPAFKGEVCALDEIVINVPALVEEMASSNQEALYKIDPFTQESLQFDEQGRLRSVMITSEEHSVEVTAQQFVFAAGAGNEFIVNSLDHPDLKMQRRPLHMVLVKMHDDYPLYAHCLGFGARPRLTITTHYMQDGACVWYLGGLLAEEGVGRDSETQIQMARKELVSLFPWIDFSQAQFASFMIDRAEPLQESGLKPDTCYMKMIQNVIVAWPTKLALAPKLAESVLNLLQQPQEAVPVFDGSALRNWPRPASVTPVWETVFCKND